MIYLPAHNKNALVTICILTYNQEQYIEEAVKSVLEQDIAGLHIIIADDASTDNTPEICKKLQKQHPKSIALILHSKNMGVVNNIESIYPRIPSNTKYLSWFAGDDIFLPCKLKKQIDFLEKHPDYVMCYHNVLVRDENKHKQYLYNHWLYGAPSYSGDIFEKLIMHGCFTAGLSVLLRYAVAKDIKHRTEVGIFNDWLYFVEIASLGKVGYLNNTLAVYRRHSNNISHKNLPIELTLSVFDYLSKYYGCDSKINQALVTLYAKFIIKSCLQKKFNLACRQFIELCKLSMTVKGVFYLIILMCKAPLNVIKLIIKTLR